jgi:hypothetical protein
MSEYGFSTRLANENYWTRNFTKKAILEYKKFMYLAATSDKMVSPSEIIDVVWHQHLIFTQSYSDFCQVLGKQIQHVPSTHNHADADKFKHAKERTHISYATVFGEQPTDIWDNPGMFEGLKLDKAKLKVRGFVLLGILIFVCLMVPFYYLLRPVYVQIRNPDFIIGFILVCGSTFTGLEFFNRAYISTIVNRLNRNCFLFDLHPMEVIYLKTQKISNVVTGTMNQLVSDRKVIVGDDYALRCVDGSKPGTLEEYIVLETLGRSGKLKYPALLKILVDKPVFVNTVKCMGAFKKYFIKSKKFGNLFYMNFGILSLVVMFGFIRLVTGLLRDRPVEQLALLLVVLLIVIILALIRLTRLVCTYAVPKYYRKKILPKQKFRDDWEWQYFLSGAAVLTPAFVPVATYVDKHSDGSTGSSCGTSCGSSCSSCGGCGGD